MKGTRNRQTYWDWQPLICTEDESYAFYHGWKTRHIEVLDPQPDVISRKKPYATRNKIPFPILPRFKKGIHYYLQEPFMMTAPVKIRDLGHRQVVIFNITYKNDDHHTHKTISLKFAPNLPDYEVDRWYEPSAMIQCLARKKFTAFKTKLERVDEITEKEAREHGVKRYCGGFYYRNYRVYHERKAEYFTSALQSFRSHFEVLTRDMPAEFQWTNNPICFSTVLRELDYMDRRENAWR